MRPAAMPRHHAAPVPALGEDVGALRERRADLLRRLSQCRRLRSLRHQALAAELAETTAALLAAELQQDRARRDRMLMRD